MHPADIKALLQKNDTPPAEVARRARVPRSTVSQVIHNRSRSRKVARLIAQLTGRRVAQLWPNDYADLQLEEARRGRL